MKAFLIRLFNWEYWPNSILWFTVLMTSVIWNSFKLKKLFYFTAVNPGIKTGGMGVESKFESLQLIPKKYRPQSILIKKSSSSQEVVEALGSSTLTFPVICKPDVGFRGLLVKKIADQNELLSYLNKYPFDFIVQEFIPFTEELGIFYHRIPGEHGHVSSITTKEFLTVSGDGQSTILNLIHKKPRAYLQIKRIQNDASINLDEIPQKGEIVSLGKIGNHALGTIFKDGRHLINPKIEKFFDELATQIDGFYYGRFDVRCDSLNDLQTGERMKIMEINGVCAEPTHMYDPYRRYSFFKAYKILRHYQNTAFKISRENIKNGVSFLSVAEVWREHKKLKRYKKIIKSLD